VAAPGAVTAVAGPTLTALLVSRVPAVLGPGSNLQYTDPGWQLLGERCQGVMVRWGPMLPAVTLAHWNRRRR